jgi:DnaD/phage-associated family protein
MLPSEGSEMAKGKRYYWFKLKQSFMTSDTVDYFMSQENGPYYVILYQTLCLKVINTGGRFSRTIGNVEIPYDTRKLQRDCKWFPLEMIEKGIEYFKQFGLLLEDEKGVLYIDNFNELVGSETDFAEQKREQREKKPRKKGGKKNGESVDNVSDNVSEIVHTDNRDKILDISSSTTTTDISSSLSPKGDTELRSKDTQNVTYTKTMDGMDRFTRKLEKPATAADYLMQIGINLDYFTAQEYEDFLSFGMDEEAIMYAAHLAQSANAVSWAYVKTILTSWLDKGIKTKAQAEEEEKKRKAERKANAGKSQSSSKSPYKPDGTYDYEAGLSSEWESL